MGQLLRLRMVPLLALLLVGCGPAGPPSALPSQPGAPASSGKGMSLRAVDPAKLTTQDVFDELRMQVFTFEVKAPAGHRATFWVETWKDGAIDQTLSESHWMQMGGDRPWIGRAQISFWDGEGINSPRSRWSWKMELTREVTTSGPGTKTTSQGKSTSSGVRWVDDPLKAKDIRARMSSKNEGLDGPCEPGKIYTLFVMAGNRGNSISLPGLGVPAEDTGKGLDVAVFLKMRLTLVSQKERTKGGGFGTASGAPKPLFE